jgi:L-histidine N-alpha-methyltransferase
MSSDDSLLLGTDLVKDRRRLVAAYDDDAGVTADFNRNVLHVLNEQLGGDFDPTRFRHVALWNEEEQWIEMRLRAEEATEVSLAGAGITVRFDEGEDLLTEISAKFTPEKVEEELYEAGFVLEDMWGAHEGEFLLTLAHPLC